MPNTAEADRKLVSWLKERTDEQLERIMEAPEDGLTGDRYRIDEDPDGTCRACLWGWAYDHRSIIADDGIGPFHPDMEPIADEATEIVFSLIPNETRMEAREAMARIKAFTAAELLTRRVNRKRLPAPQASADGMGELYALEVE